MFCGNVDKVIVLQKRGKKGRKKAKGNALSDWGHWRTCVGSSNYFLFYFKDEKSPGPYVNCPSLYRQHKLGQFSKGSSFLAENAALGRVIKKRKTPCTVWYKGFWRRRRDSNPRDPFGAYTISNRARSTKLRDFSVFALRMRRVKIVLSNATLAIIAGFEKKSRGKIKKRKKILDDGITGRNCGHRWCSTEYGFCRPKRPWR